MSEQAVGLSVVIKGNAVQFEDTMTDVNNALKLVKNELVNVNKGLKFDSNNVELLNKKFSILEDSVEVTTKKLNKHKEELESLGNYNDLATQKEKDKWLRIQKEITRTESDLRAYTQQLDVTGKKLDQLEEDRITQLKIEEEAASKKLIQDRLQQLEELSGFKATATIDADGNIKSTLLKVESDLKDIDGMKSTATIEVDSSQAQKSIDDVTSELDSINGLIAGAVGAEATEGITEAVNRSGTEAANMGKIRAKFENETTALDKAFSNVSQIGADFGFSTADIAQIGGIVASNTSSVEEWEKGMRAAIKTSAAYALKEGDIAEATQQSVTATESLRDIIVFGTTTAWEDAGIQIDQFIKRMEKSGKISKSELKTMRDGSKSNEEYAEAMWKALSAGDRIDIYTEQLDAQFGDMYNGMSKNEKQAFETSAAMADAGATIRESWQRIGQIISPVIEIISKVISNFPSITTAIVGIGAALAVVVGVLGTFGILLSGVTTLFGSIGGLISIIGPIFATIGSALSALGPIITSIGGLFAAASLPVTALIGAVVLLITTMWNLGDESLGVFGRLGSGFMVMVQNFLNGLTIIGSKISEFWGLTKEKFSSGVTFIKGKFVELQLFIQGMGKSIYNYIISPFKNAFNYISSLFSGLFGWFGEKIANAKNSISNIRNNSTTNNNQKTITNNYYTSDLGIQKNSLFKRTQIQKGLM